MASVLNLPPVGTMVTPSTAFTPALMTGITVHPENPLMFDFTIEEGDRDIQGQELRDESQKLIKYFLAAVTVPEKDLWVNLSPYEQNKIIPQGFGDTEMGRDLLGQDYLLKQLAASMMYPEEALGKQFWGRVYQKAKELYGTTEIPLNTFNKIWIVPDKAVVFEHGSSAFVTESHLKVMLEEDYIALKNNLDNKKFGLNHLQTNDAKVLSGVTSDVVREVLIPAIEEEVNHGKTFANLRQVYNSMILATWYKRNLKESLLGKVYADRNKTKGIDTQDKQVNEKIYNQYLEAFQKGVYNYIRTDYDKAAQKEIPRKYFSGGFDGVQIEHALEVTGVGSRPVSSPLELANVLRHRALIAGAGDVGAVDRWAQTAFQRLPASEQNQVRQAVASPVGAVDRVRTVLVEDTNPQRLAEAVQPQRVSSPVSTDSYQGVSQKDALKFLSGYNRAKVPVTTGDAALNQSLENARAYLNLTGPKKAIKIQVVENAGQPQGTTFGAVVTEEQGVKNVVFERSFLNDIVRRSNPFDMVTRVVVNLLTEGTAHEKRVAEYEYAKQINPEGVKRLLPQDGVTIEDILARVKKNILPYLSKQEIAQDSVFSKYKDKIIFANNTTRHVGAELERRAREALYKIAVNAMNKEINTRRYIRLSDTDRSFTDQEKEEGPVTVGTLAYAGHPPSIAHMIVAGLQAMAESKADRFVLLLTRADHRKSHLLPTYPVRFRLSQHLLNTLFDGLIVLMPTLSEDNDPIRGLNGEEKVLPFLKLNEGIRMNFLYGIGGDHYLSFNRKEEGEQGQPKIKTGPLKWEKELTPDNLYYIRKKGYKDLIRMFLKAFSDEIPQKKKQILTDMINAPIEPADFFELQMEENVIPELDTIGKLYLLQGELEDSQKQRIGLINTVRQALPPDTLRDKLVRSNLDTGDQSTIYVVMNEGIQEEISSSDIRKALIELARNGTLDLNAFFGISTEGLRLILSDQYMKYTRSLVRHGEPVLPKSVRALLPRGDQAERQRDLFNALQTSLKAIDANIVVEEGAEGDLSVIRVWRAKGGKPVGEKPLVEVTYNVKSTLTETSFAQPPISMLDEDPHNAAMPQIISFIRHYIFSPMTASRSYPALEVLDETDTDQGKIYTVRETRVIDNRGQSETKIQDYTLELRTNEETQEITYIVSRKGDTEPLFQPYQETRTSREQMVLALRRYAERLNRLGPVVDLETANGPGTIGSSPLLAAPEAQGNPGGIDLNPALLDLQIKRDANFVPLPLPQQPIGTMHIEGFAPVILNIELVPASPIPFLSGAQQPEKKSGDLSFQWQETSPLFDPQELLV